MRKAVLILCVSLSLVLFVCTASSVAQEQTADSISGLQTKVETLTETRESIGTYIINPLDRLVIVVYAGDRLLEEFDEFVKSDGTVYLPFLEKDIDIGGMRILEAEDEIEKLSREFIREPRVVITVTSSYYQTVSTYGKIRNMDVEIRTPMRILQLLARAGGPEDDAKADSVRVISVDGTVRYFNYERVNRNPNNLENFFLKPGDIVFVPGIDDFTVTILGNVSSPGTYPMKKDSKLLEAIVKAGSWGIDADIKNLRLLRVRVGKRIEVKKINLKDIFDKGNVSLNYLLEDGDIIFIPTRRTQLFLSMLYTGVLMISSIISMYVLIDSLKD